jgi:hypothetical protein
MCQLQVPIMSDLGRLGEWLDFAASVDDRSGSVAEEGATYSVKPPRSGTRRRPTCSAA